MCPRQRATAQAQHFAEFENALSVWSPDIDVSKLCSYIALERELIPPLVLRHDFALVRGSVALNLSDPNGATTGMDEANHFLRESCSSFRRYHFLKRDNAGAVLPPPDWTRLSSRHCQDLHQAVHNSPKRRSVGCSRGF